MEKKLILVIWLLNVTEYFVVRCVRGGREKLYAWKSFYWFTI